MEDKKQKVDVLEAMKIYGVDPEVIDAVSGLIDAAAGYLLIDSVATVKKLYAALDRVGRTI